MKPPLLSRRDFSRAAAAALAGGALARPGATAAQAPAPAAASPEAEVQAQVARILALYGHRLTPAQRQRLPGIVAGHVAMLGPVRAVAMRNSDPPATVLRLVTAGQAGGGHHA
ncbi:MAG TPA: hypothetical protein VMV31_07905 [Terriglobales bacterium]|nr:hypothetical protein [Terriglobales bacterium]